MQRSNQQMVTKQRIRVSSGKDNGNGYGVNLAYREAFTIRNKYEKQRLIPQKYLEIKAQIKTRINEFAYTYVPRMYKALTQSGIEGKIARQIVTADGLDLGWKYNTIRVALPTESKNQNKAKGGRKAAQIRTEKKKAKISVEDGNGHKDEIDVVQVQENVCVLTLQDVQEISDASDKSLKNDGDGSVKLQFENKEGRMVVKNISVFK